MLKLSARSVDAHVVLLALQEMENLKAADELLKKLGLKSSLFGVSPPMTPAADKQEHEQQ